MPDEGQSPVTALLLADHFAGEPVPAFVRPWRSGPDFAQTSVDAHLCTHAPTATRCSTPLPPVALAVLGAPRVFEPEQNARPEKSARSNAHMTMQTPITRVDLDPRSLLVDVNIRIGVRLDEDFVAGIKELRVLVPIV